MYIYYKLEKQKKRGGGVDQCPYILYKLSMQNNFIFSCLAAAIEHLS